MTFGIFSFYRLFNPLGYSGTSFFSRYFTPSLTFFQYKPLFNYTLLPTTYYSQTLPTLTKKIAAAPVKKPSSFSELVQSITHRGWSAVKTFGLNIASVAAKYLGFNERNGSYKKFTNGKRHAWCADFVSYVTKEAYRLAGKALPSGFGSSSVSGLMSWGIRNNRYLKTSGLSNKSQYIKQNIKSGDIIIFKNNGRSHTGIVEKVGADGKIYTIEGNTSNKVARRTYSANNSTISGFVKMA